jgi:two-component system, NtrC family, sensor kinase
LASFDLQHELDAARERLTATSSILRAIAVSPGDVEGSLHKIAETTARLFGAAGVSFRIAEGDEFKLSVGVGQGAEEVGSSLYANPAIRPTVGGRNLAGTVVRENRQIHLPDLDHLDGEFADWPGPPVARRAGIRTTVGTPLRTSGRAFGALMVYRNVLQPFAPAELQSLQSFADQAVIAIETARLFEAEQQRTRELSESLEQQTVTAGILEVISNSPTNSQPAFERDNGTGIPPDVKDKMFNPFFTTKPAGEGTGLGLSISHDIIVKQHGGSIEIDTESGQFTEFRITLPRTAVAAGQTGVKA